MHLKQVKTENMEKLKFVFLYVHASYLQITNGNLQTQNLLRTFLLMQLLLPLYRNGKKGRVGSAGLLCFLTYKVVQI